MNDIQLNDQSFMAEAYTEALAGYQQGGAPVYIMQGLKVVYKTRSE